MYPRVIPRIPKTAGTTGGAGIGSRTEAKMKPVIKPVANDARLW